MGWLSDLFQTVQIANEVIDQLSPTPCTGSQVCQPESVFLRRKILLDVMSTLPETNSLHLKKSLHKKKRLVFQLQQFHVSGAILVVLLGRVWCQF